ncbi:hypothetical protein [Cupriavidus sp. D39]|uniref:hypothetical protein n=1 Tax=Cupriavidus sp. D39 TaxID=2997877 RepID=UPI002272091E|nr:hypothetical protein [Cupriavidus sp. D39]MCY0852608.1 hypothetical protein [Cupriavidus sp. D39]
MATFSRDEAVNKAVELVNTALAAGLLKDVVPCSFNHPDKSGSETSQYLGGLLRGLAKELADM